MTADRNPIGVLVLCTGNSCRSIFAEALLNARGEGRFAAYSAGSRPAGAVNTYALEKLEREGIETDGLRSKSWDEFTAADAPAIDVVITVCDGAAGASCPVWNGTPLTVHWGIPDPATARGSDILPAFDRAFSQLAERIRLMLQLPLESMDRRERADALARIHDAARQAERSAD